MDETTKVTRLLRDFENKFGFKTYETLKSFMFTLYRKIEDLEKSRNNWKLKYYKLKENKK